MKILSSCRLLSHPDKPLKDHLFNTAKESEKILSPKEINLKIEKEFLMDVSYLIGLCHDFGKATQYFQDYMGESDEKKKMIMKNKPETNHGLLSAIFTYFVLQEYLKPNCVSESLFPIMGYLIVKRHHGNLKDISAEILDLRKLKDGEDGREILDKQIKSIYKNEISKIYSSSLYDIDIHEFFTRYPSIITDIRKSRMEIISLLKKEKDVENPLILQLLYSILISSDKTDASGIRIERIGEKISPDLVDKYKKLKWPGEAKKKINIIRNDIYDDIMAKVKDLDLNKKIYSLNVPTGTGKTLASFSFALKLREKLAEKGPAPRIIYSLPFMSIIDQNFDDLLKVFQKVTGKKPTTDILLKHHHLAKIFFDSKKDDEFETNESHFLIEGWNSEVIVTTFVQFFHTLISNKNRALQKYHRIINSIVILDEVQAIPHKYWPLFKEVISNFSRCFNTYFIFVTATQPLIFNPETEIEELVDDKEGYFKDLNRTVLFPKLDDISFDQFKEIVREDIENNEKKDFLIVLNTINSTKELYKHLVSFNGSGRKYYCLSTEILPKKRLERIKQIKLDEGRKVIVSTPLIEAGVDIDVDIVYRDFSTLDSINQVAGRCNRNYKEEEKGLVKVFVLKDEHNRKYYQYIYGDSVVLINATRDVLYKHSKIDEKMFLELIKEYYKKIKGRMSDDESDDLLSNLFSLEFEALHNFKLIKEDYFKVDVFIELDDAAKRIWQEHQRIKSMEKPLERKAAFLKIKRQFYDHVISIPEKYATGLMIDENEETGYVPHDVLETYYDFDTGFRREDAGSGSIIC